MAHRRHPGSAGVVGVSRRGEKMNCNQCITIGHTADGDYGDITHVFYDPVIGILPDLSALRFLYRDGSSRRFASMPLDDREDARRLVEALNDG